MNKIHKISDKSIELLVDYYNREGEMPNEVEIENAYYDYNDISIKWESVLYNLTNEDGEVDITIPEEKMYSREEVIELIDYLEDKRQYFLEKGLNNESETKLKYFEDARINSKE